jgi:orotate phosphoribosyltransferase
LIAGVPRSGLLAATLLALHTNLPFTDVDGLIAGRVLSHGRRLPQPHAARLPHYTRKVLVFDDSVCSGFEMKRVKSTVEAASLPYDITYGAVFGVPHREHDVDVVMELCPLPRVFEWNIMHHSLLSDTCMDIDGVLCKDPTEAENDDGERYRRFLQAAEPHLLPTAEVGYLVTSRLGKYRHLTEAWLLRHGVRYRNLFMLDLPSKEARVAARAHVPFKSSVYRSTGALLFIESSLCQATAIADTAAKCVFCTDTYEMIYPAASALTYAAQRKLAGVISRRARFASSRMGRIVMRFVRYGS